MSLEYVYNTKWDMSDWTSEMKTRWLDKCTKLGCSNKHAAEACNLVFISGKGCLQNCGEDREFFNEDTNKLALFTDMFPEEKVVTRKHVKEKGWTASHYDVNYTLSKKEIEQGFVRLDTYKVNKAWGLNSVDATGAAFHCLKTLNRIPRQKNPLERELRALVGQIKCWSNEEEIDLSDILK